MIKAVTQHRRSQQKTDGVEAAAHNHNGGNDLKNIIDCYKILVAGRGDLS